MMSAWAHSLIIQKISMAVFMSWVISKIYHKWQILDEDNLNLENEKTGEPWRRVSWPDLFKYYDIDLRGQYLTFFPTVKIILATDPSNDQEVNSVSVGLDDELFDITPLKIVAGLAVTAVLCATLYKVTLRQLIWEQRLQKNTYLISYGQFKFRFHEKLLNKQPAFSHASHVNTFTN